MVQRTVPEVDVVSDRVGWKVKLDARHGFLSGRSREVPAMIPNHRGVGQFGSSPVFMLLTGAPGWRDSPTLMCHRGVGTPGPIV